MEGMCHYCKHKIKNYDEEPCSSCRATDGKFDGIDIPSPWRDVREVWDNIFEWIDCNIYAVVVPENGEPRLVVDANRLKEMLAKVLPAPPAGEE